MFFRKLAAGLVAIALWSLFGVASAEIILRLFLPDSNRYYLWPPNYATTFTPRSDVMPGVGPVAHIKTNSQGIRGPEWSKNRAEEYRILAIGGSTTECVYLDQEKAWPALLQAGLGKTVNGRRVWVGNLGKAGFNTRDHLALMRLVIEQYDVDAIVMLIGGNDMVHRLMQGERYDPHFVEDEARYRNWVSSRFWMVPLTMQSAEGLFFKRTALWRLAKQLKYLYLYKGMVQDDTGAWLVKLRKLRQLASLIDELPPIDSGLNEYRRNVEAIIQEARRHSIRVVLLTQPTLWKTTMPDQESDLLWMGGRPDGSFYTSSALARAMNSYNQQLLDTCAKLEAESIDLAASVPRTLDIFYDDMHFTETGAQRVAADLVAYFRMRAPFSASSH